MRHRVALLSLLSDNRFHSGAALGACLGVSRSAVWKLMRSLASEGFDVHAVRGRGYRLAEPLELLDARRIRAELGDRAQALVPSIVVLEEVDSTNSALSARAVAGAPSGTVVVAEGQSAGRGRRGRAWSSPFGRNLYLSMLWRFAVQPEAIQGLSLALGVAVAEGCQRLGVDGIELKWPNDLVAEHGKVAGILVELSGELSGTLAVVIGVGVNVDMPTRLCSRIDRAVTDISSLAGRRISRNLLAATVIDAFADALPRFERDGFAPFRVRFGDRDSSRDRTVSVELPNEQRIGTARGVDERGALLLETVDGVQRITGGEVSLRGLT